MGEVMKASEAKELSDAGEQLTSVKRWIEKAALKGETHITHSLSGPIIRKLLIEDGYHLSDEIDCDNSYVGTTISWIRPKK
jgi:hypothetical protein